MAIPLARPGQLRLARWLVGQGFDPLVIHTTKPGDDGEEDPARSLAGVLCGRAGAEQHAGPLLPEAGRGAGRAVCGRVVGQPRDRQRPGGTRRGHQPLGRRHARCTWPSSVLDRGTAGKPELARRRLRMVKTLLKLGADPNIPGAPERDAPAHCLGEGLRRGGVQAVAEARRRPDRARENRAVRATLLRGRKTSATSTPLLESEIRSIRRTRTPSSLRSGLLLFGPRRIRGTACRSSD